MGSPSQLTCNSSRCQPLGLTNNVGKLPSLNLYSLLLAEKVIVLLLSSYRAFYPEMILL